MGAMFDERFVPMPIRQSHSMNEDFARFQLGSSGRRSRQRSRRRATGASSFSSEGGDSATSGGKRLGLFRRTKPLAS
uniref:Uncharacterized protein n=1 Tax=Plectus sambesii TaxID=2011161 RepID=A0A914WEI6_9BILA